MRLSKLTKATFALAFTLALAGGVAWAQNLEVKGSAWFATAGGQTGVGTKTPLGQLHVMGGGALGSETSDGYSLAGTVPVVMQAQSDGTALAILNGDTRQLFAVAVSGNNHTSTSRGTVTFYDKANGTWNASLSMAQGYVGIGLAPDVGGRKLAVLGDIYASGQLVSDQGWYTRSGAGLHMASDGVTLTSPNALSVGGAVGIGMAPDATSYYKLSVNGPINVASSEVIFSNTTHKASVTGNTAGFAAIQNAQDYNTLMILGRAGTAQGRRVDVWDYLQVNGNTYVTGTVTANRVDGSAAQTLYSCPPVLYTTTTTGYGGTTTTVYNVGCGKVGSSTTCSAGGQSVSCTAVGRILKP